MALILRMDMLRWEDRVFLNHSVVKLLQLNFFEMIKVI